MNGSDHQRPQPSLPRPAGRGQRGSRTTSSSSQLSLAEYLADRADRRPGPLERGAAERGQGQPPHGRPLEPGRHQGGGRGRRAGNWSGGPSRWPPLWLPRQRWPADLLDEAWLAVVRNAAHDSVCACSADAVGRAVRHRYDVATALAGEVIAAWPWPWPNSAHRTTPGPGRSVNPGPVQATPSGRSGAAGQRSVPDTQVAGSPSPEGRGGAPRHWGRLGPPPRRAHRRRLAGQRTRRRRRTSSPATRRPGGDRSSRRQPASVAPDGVGDGGSVGAGRAPTATTRWRVRVERRPSQRVAARVAGRPRLRVGAVPAGARGRRGRPGRGHLAGQLRACGSRWTPRPAPSPSTAWAGLDRLVDGGDEGDTYNHSAASPDSVVDMPDRVERRPGRKRTGAGHLRMTQHFTWPAGVVDGRRAGGRPVVIVTDLQLHAGEDARPGGDRFDNPSRDHRLRAWFPAPPPGRAHAWPSARSPP